MIKGAAIKFFQHTHLPLVMFIITVRQSKKSKE